jgi:hypothetical protein
MQTLWARILAGEANTPGKFTKRTVNIVGSLDKTDATLFSQFCRFVITIAYPTPLIFRPDHKIYNEVGINFGTLNHLESAGLIHLNAGGEYLQSHMSPRNLAHYFGSQFWIEFRQGGQLNALNTGLVIFTTSGAELARLSGAQPREGFLDFVAEHWKRYGITIHRDVLTGNRATK